jgi:hypothetical protein
LSSDQAKVRAVEAALAESLGADGAAKATRRWQEAYAALPGGGVVRFVQELAEHHQLEPTVRRRLRMDLFQAIFGADTGGSASKSTSTPAEPAPASAPRSPGQQVCAVMVVSMLSQAAAADRRALLNEIQSHVRDAGAMDERFQEALSQWDGNGDPPVPASDDGLHGLAHAAWLGLCELYGPSEGDRIMRRAVERVEGMAAAVEHPPRKLL